MEAHRHLVHGRIFEALALALCECGEELQLERNKWRAPKTLEGKMRREKWAAREREQA